MVINGATGPYTAQVGGYGKNTAHNVQQFVANNSGPKGPAGSLKPDSIMDIFKTISGEGGPENILGKMEEMLKGQMPSAPELPDVQYTEEARLSDDSMYQDLFGFSTQIMAQPLQGPTGPSPLPTLPPDSEGAKKFDSMRNMIKGALSLLSMLSPSIKDIEEKLKPILDADPNKALEDMMKNGPMGNMKDMMNTQSKNYGLSNEVLDRNKDGKVDIAEKAAETLFLDNSINLMKDEVADKLADPTLMIQDFDKSMAYSTLSTSLDKETSKFDGQITVNERKWGVTVAENKATTSLVSGILDKLLLNHDLRAKAPTE